MVNRHVALAAAGLVIAGQHGNALQQGRFAGPFSPTMTVMARSNASPNPLRRNGRQKG
jgi:L-asparaginase II